MSGEIAPLCQQLLAAEAARRPTEVIPEALEWALAWSLTGLPFEQAARWCDLPVPLADLPVAAAVATRHGVAPWLIEAWIELGVLPTVGDIPVIGELQGAGWGTPALDFVATAGSFDASPAAELLARLFALPRVAILDGIRCGLDLPAAVELAEYAEAGGATGQLLSRLLRDRVVSEELGARINVAITDIGDAMPTGLWATPAEQDARVTRSMRASLPKVLWAVFLSADEEFPGPPEHTSGAAEQIPLTPNRAVGDVTRDVLAGFARLAGPVFINTVPQEVPWSLPLDRDDEHTTYDPEQVRAYFAAATHAARVLTAFRAPFRGRATPVVAWWGTFDLAVNLFSGRPVVPPSDDFLARNGADAEQIAVGWWPGDVRYPRAAFYGFAYPAPEGLSSAVLPPPARWAPELDEFVLDWDDVRAAADPDGEALSFARSVFHHASALAGWDDVLTGSMDGDPPPLRPPRGT
jgi:hypothetical protein